MGHLGYRVGPQGSLAQISRLRGGEYNNYRHHSHETQRNLTESDHQTITKAIISTKVQEETTLDVHDLILKAVKIIALEVTLLGEVTASYPKKTEKTNTTSNVTDVEQRKYSSRMFHQESQKTTSQR